MPPTPDLRPAVQRQSPVSFAVGSSAIPAPTAADAAHGRCLSGSVRTRTLNTVTAGRRKLMATAFTPPRVARHAMPSYLVNMTAASELAALIPRSRSPASSPSSPSCRAGWSDSGAVIAKRTADYQHIAPTLSVCAPQRISAGIAPCRQC